ncbi:canopy family protein seele isoform X3 [Tachypleus tridentatus]|uniref:canopy family protein seele isoform X3 n=1 Tax=Tachypleus tridentatus TaxID=6853 RepID=UPI003FD2B709
MVRSYLKLLMLEVLLVCFFGSKTLASQDIKCLVCQTMVDEIVKAVELEDPRKTIQVGSFRIQPDGSQKQAQVPYVASETHLHELFDGLCEKFDDYAQATHKETKELALLNLSEQIALLSNYNIVPDPDLNKSLKTACESIIGDFEDDLMMLLHKVSKPDSFKMKINFCRKVTGKIITDKDESVMAMAHS